MTRKLELTGKTFGKLYVVKIYDGPRKSQHTFWECECQCELKTKVVVRGSYLVSGTAKTCHKCARLENVIFERNDYLFCLSSQGDEILFDKQDINIINLRKWDTAGRYAKAKIKDKTVLLHRLIVDPPANKYVDHINGNTYDNRRSNLRICTNSENQSNKHVSYGQSEYKGVSRSGDRYRKPWRATIKSKGKTISIGVFWTEEEAARAYDAKAKELFGDFAKFNFS